LNTTESRPTLLSPLNAAAAIKLRRHLCH
jgi:hypothetical protein